MVILTKYKDYYDYLVGVYGRDENKVFDRRRMITADEFPFEQDISFDARLSKYGSRHHLMFDFRNTVSISINNKTYSVTQTAPNIWEQFQENSPRYDINNEFRQPIILDISGMEVGTIFTDRIPLLSSFGFAKFLPPEFVYTEIETFLGWLKDNPPIQDKRTDLEKLQSNGFDKRISFRHRK